MDHLLYKDTATLRVGHVHRYVLTYTPEDPVAALGSSLYVRVKNTENILLNSVLLTAPYLIYCDIRPEEYSHDKACFISDDQPVYDPNIIPGQSLTHKLSLHRVQDKFVWIVDIVSQIIFSTSAEINFEILVASDQSALSMSHSSIKNSNYSPQNLHIQHLRTEDIWNKPPNSLTDPIHLVILTHGLHSNSSADMFYMKEQIEHMADKTGENIVIRAYMDNVCKTERGVKYLGRRLAEYIINDSMTDLDTDNIKKISFISHSLGGPVQAFAISYINFNYPAFFDKFSPENFITMASPLLGISNENPAYVKAFLKFGIVGKTGQDLNLDGNQPLLLLLPSGTTRKILKRFKRRTVYANVLNDGIVPLRTSALLYLDWKALTKVYHTLHSNPPDSENAESGDQVGEIPVEIDNEIQSVAEQDPRNDSTNVPVTKTVLNVLKSKIQSTIGLCLPNLQAPKTTQKYNYFQTTTDEVVDGDDKEGAPTNMDILKDKLPAIPKPSVLSSLTKIILPPQPTTKYLNDPKSRYDAILHDKIYTPDMIPRKHTTLSKNIIVSQLEQGKRHRFLEEKIARRWHQGMAWRKVLVYLQPDAHNNMVVRRRFANAYGWQVVDHMVENHFGKDAVNGVDAEKWNISKDKTFVDMDETEVDDLNKKFGEVMHKEFRKENGDVENQETKFNSSKDENEEDDEDDEEKSEDEDDDCGWLNEVESGYYDGPTGMFNTVNENMNAWKDSMLTPKGDLGDNSESNVNGNTVDPELEEYSDFTQANDLNKYL